jgi:hypothetical protein
MKKQIVLEKNLNTIKTKHCRSKKVLKILNETLEIYQIIKIKKK